MIRNDIVGLIRLLIKTRAIDSTYQVDDERPFPRFDIKLIGFGFRLVWSTEKGKHIYHWDFRHSAERAAVDYFFAHMRDEEVDWDNEPTGWARSVGRSGTLRINREA